MRKAIWLFLLAAGMLAAQDGKLRIIAFGAHPDDCDVRLGGTAAQFAAMGHLVKFVSVTSGDAGHQSQGGGALAARRRLEAKEAGRRFGIAEYETLDNHDGELVPSLQVREQIIRRIRQWNADIVIGPRSNDYHPDHRYTGILLADAAFMVTVPNICPDTPALKKNPVFLYVQDNFQRPNPFRPDIAVAIDSTVDKKMYALSAHESQFFEWLPWLSGKLDQVPKDEAGRRKWLESERVREANPEVRKALEKWYGAAKAKGIRYAEAFEICEYGRRPSDQEIRQLFPMLK